MSKKSAFRDLTPEEAEEWERRRRLNGGEGIFYSEVVRDRNAALWESLARVLMHHLGTADPAEVDDCLVAWRANLLNAVPLAKPRRRRTVARLTLAAALFALAIAVALFHSLVFWHYLIGVPLGYVQFAMDDGLTYATYGLTASAAVLGALVVDDWARDR